MAQESTEGNQKLTKKIRPYKIIYPIVIGLAVVSYMLYKEFDPKAFDMITFTWNTVFWLFVALLCMAIRDFGYVVRIRVLSGDKLTWLQSLRIIFLWEFTSAVTPSAIGGTSLAILFVHKEGIGAGLCNVFEQVAIPDHLELNYIKSIMMSYGAYGAQMTGSGSAVYGLFDSFEYAAVACTMLKDNYPQVFIAKTV